MSSSSQYYRNVDDTRVSAFQLKTATVMLPLDTLSNMNRKSVKCYAGHQLHEHVTMGRDLIKAVL